MSTSQSTQIPTIRQFDVVGIEATQTPGRMNVTHDGNHWSGTFRVMVEALIKDVLDDGEPIEVTAFSDAGIREGREHFTCTTGQVCAIDEQHLIFTGGLRLARTELISIGI